RSCSTRVFWFPAPGPFPRMQCGLPRSRLSRPGLAALRTRRRSPRPSWISRRRPLGYGRPWPEGPRRLSEPGRRRVTPVRATPASVVPGRPLRRPTLRRQARAVPVAPPKRLLELRPVRATRTALPARPQKERPAGQAAEETLVFEPSRAEDEGLTEDMAQEAPGVEGAPISEPTEARDEGTVAIVPVPTAQEGATAVVELPDSSGEYGDSMDIDPAASGSAAAHIVEFASASAGVFEAGASEGSHLGVIVPSGVPSEFLRKEQEEEEAWNKQMGVGHEILQALDRAYQLHQNAYYQVSQVSISPRKLLRIGFNFSRVFTHTVPLCSS